MTRHKLAWLIALGLVAGVPALASADTLYANLPAGATDLGGWTFSSPTQYISDSFTLAGSSVVLGVEFLSRNQPGYPIAAVDWVISSGDVFNGYGTIWGSGTASVSADLLLIYYPENRALMSDAFTLGTGIPLDAGTYFLTLGHAQAGGTNASWVINDGPSSAWNNRWGSLAGCVMPGLTPPCSGSESFQIMGVPSTTSVPEPASFLLLATGLAGAVRTMRRRRS